MECDDIAVGGCEVEDASMWMVRVTGSGQVWRSVGGPLSVIKMGIDGGLSTTHQCGPAHRIYPSVQLVLMQDNTCAGSGFVGL